MTSTTRERGWIQAINFTQGSGLATLFILTVDGDVEAVHCDAGPLARALQESGAGVGTEIEYSMTSMGTMAGFGIVGEN